MTNPNINKVTLKTAKGRGVHRFFFQDFFFFKIVLYLPLFTPHKNEASFVIFYRKENYWTYADSCKPKRCSFIHLSDLEQRASHLEMFSPSFHSMLSHTQDSPAMARTKLQTPQTTDLATHLHMVQHDKIH